MMRFLLIALFALAIPAAARAQIDDLTGQDSVYFTLDDGIMTPDEMEKEAGYVYRLCAENPYQSTYFNCECLAGAFLLQREKLGPMTPQYQILDRLMKSSSAQCPNTPAIAGDAYKTCNAYVRSRRELANDNREFCECVANRVANRFDRSPRLSTQYVGALTSNAINYCENPQNRPKKTAATSVPNQ